MVQPINPGRPPIPPTPPVNKNSGGSTTPQLGGNPGLITSTGGLFGIDGVLLTPVQNYTTGKSYVLIMDPSNFNCEEPAEYDYPEFIPQEHEGEDVTCHLVILKYREIGTAKFNINISSYIRDMDDFEVKSYPIVIPPAPLKGKRKLLFPDNKIHTMYVTVETSGERPQVFITSDGDKGSYSITSLTLCGNADQSKQR